MGAPKQKWTSEEEAALKAGVAKYGVGKWSTILKDPEFAVVLRSRSNVDLKFCLDRINGGIYMSWQVDGDLGIGGRLCLKVLSLHRSTMTAPWLAM